MNILLEKQKVNELKKEKKLLILLSRTKFSEEHVKEINTILKDKYFVCECSQMRFALSISISHLKE